MAELCKAQLNVAGVRAVCVKRNNRNHKLHRGPMEVWRASTTTAQTGQQQTPFGRWEPVRPWAVLEWGHE